MYIFHLQLTLIFPLTDGNFQHFWCEVTRSGARLPAARHDPVTKTCLKRKYNIPMKSHDELSDKGWAYVVGKILMLFSLCLLKKIGTFGARLPAASPRLKVADISMNFSCMLFSFIKK